MKRLLLPLFIIAIAFIGCNPDHYALAFGCVIDEVACEGALPQKGTILEIPVSYLEVQTKFQPAVYVQPFRYRALIDGVEYSYAENPDYLYHNSTGEPEFLKIAVPENDSYSFRDVKVEVSLSAKYNKEDWQEWREVYSGKQSPLDPGQPRRLEGMDTWTVQFIFDGTVMSVDLADTEPSRCLKALLLDGDVALETSLANNGIFLHGSDALASHIPLFKKHYTKFSQGDIYMSDMSAITIANETRKKGINGYETYLGKITSSSLKALDKLCYEDKYMGLETFPITLHLEK